MNSHTCRAVLIAAATASVLLGAGVGTAQAYTYPTVEEGRTRIQVTAFPAADLQFCLTKIDGGAWRPQFGGPSQPESYLFEGVSEGTHEIKVSCRNSLFMDTLRTSPVNVRAADPMSDAIDNAMLAAGSSAMTSDTTLR